MVGRGDGDGWVYSTLHSECSRSGRTSRGLDSDVSVTQPKVRKSLLGPVSDLFDCVLIALMSIAWLPIPPMEVIFSVQPQLSITEPIC